jgi:4-alpha-glucanotransferase
MWLVPNGASPKEGAYLRYPLDDLLRLIALESWRHRAIVIGEDLGTVPDGFGERLACAGVLGIRVLWFQRDKEHISHLYVSPMLTARSGSTHGYDIVDPTRINPELGG